MVGRREDIGGVRVSHAGAPGKRAFGQRALHILTAVPPRFDDEALTLELSVADLLDSRLRRNLGFTSRGGYERMWMGQAIHSRYQEQAIADDPGYRREVSLRLELDHRGWKVVVHGRADGLRPRPGGGVVVEEIKSVRSGGQLSSALREIYQQQALLYGWMLKRLGEESVAVELVLIEIGCEGVERQPIELDDREVDGEVRRRLNALLRGFEGERAAAADRRAAAGRLTFPYAAERPGQERIQSAVAEALESSSHLFIEAPTGIGKTVAALYPALRFALENEQRVFVLTAKTLQQEMATQVLALLNNERSFRSLRLRAKAKMCANGEVICHEEFCHYARDYHLKVQQSAIVHRLAAEHSTLLPDEIFAAARATEVCPFEVSLELAGRAQVVVCDYNYAFDPYVSLADFAGDADLSNVVLIVDEIHNLVGRGRGYYSPLLSARAARAAAEVLGKGAPAERAAAELCRRLGELITRWADEALEEGGGRRQEAAETALPEEELWLLRPDLDQAFVDFIEFQRDTGNYRAEDPFVGLYFDFLRFLDGLHVSTGPGFSHCVDRVGDDSRLRVLCKDPSRLLGAVINRVRSAIGLSATLSPPEFYRDLLGFDRERTAFLSVPTPFPKENRRVVIDDRVATTWRERADNFAPIAERLSSLVRRVPGNCLALFPSYVFLDEVHRRLDLPGRTVLAQQRGDSDRQREEMLTALRSPLAGDVLLLAVAGGVFAEGVDYPGEMLRAVAVVGPCLPSVSLERELLRRYYEERFERGFEYAFVVPGMTRVVQAAGRLIRSAEDIGVIALFDRRFLHTPYRFHLPQDWLDGQEPELLVGDPGLAAAEFFAAACREVE
jgi:DNA excision repair protein ERCC-2